MRVCALAVNGHGTSGGLHVAEADTGNGRHAAAQRDHVQQYRPLAVRTRHDVHHPSVSRRNGTENIASTILRDNVTGETSDTPQLIQRKALRCAGPATYNAPQHEVRLDQHRTTTGNPITRISGEDV